MGRIINHSVTQSKCDIAPLHDTLLRGTPSPSTMKSGFKSVQRKPGEFVRDRRLSSSERQFQVTGPTTQKAMLHDRSAYKRDKQVAMERRGQQSLQAKAELL